MPREVTQTQSEGPEIHTDHVQAIIDGEVEAPSPAIALMAERIRSARAEVKVVFDHIEQANRALSSMQGRAIELRAILEQYTTDIAELTCH